MMNFLDKVIRKAQTLPFENTFCMALTEYIVRKGALGWDEDRKFSGFSLLQVNLR